MNVTPLVDVVLVLLIIFMVVLPAMTQGVEVKVPSIFHVDPSQPDDTEPHVLSLTREGALYFGDERIDEAQLVGHLRRASHEAPGRRLVVRADGRAPYGRVRRLYLAAQGVSFPGVSLRVSRQHDGDTGPSEER